MSIISAQPAQLPPVHDTTEGLYNPRFYKRVEILGFNYQRPTIIGLGLNDLLRERWHAHYKQERPGELDPAGEIDTIKYNAWWAKHFDTKAVKLIFLNTILLREANSDTPTHEEIYAFFPPDEYMNLHDFFEPTSKDNTTAPQSSIASTRSDAPSSPEVKA